MQIAHLWRLAERGMAWNAWRPETPRSGRMVRVVAQAEAGTPAASSPAAASRGGATQAASCSAT